MDQINGNRPTANLSMEAANRTTGLTLGELRALLQEAMRNDMGDRSTIKITAGWRQQIQRIEVRG